MFGLFPMTSDFIHNVLLQIINVYLLYYFNNVDYYFVFRNYIDTYLYIIRLLLVRFLVFIGQSIIFM